MTMKKFLLAFAASGLVLAGHAQSSIPPNADGSLLNKEADSTEPVNAKSVAPSKMNTVRVHPVPVQGSTNVDCPAGILSITVRRTDGNIIQQIPVNGAQHVVVTFQHRGIHVLEVMDRDGIRHVMRILVESV
jgi:hypothetical protein